MSDRSTRFVGDPDFHDGFVRAVEHSEHRVFVTVEGASGKHYAVAFDGVRSVESFSPQDMMLYGLSETDKGSDGLYHYNFINWYVDEPNREESKSYLRIVGESFAITEAE